MKWRELFRSVHRDIGYVLVALVLAYGLSGLAVNHIEDWNPSYTFDHRAVAIGPVPAGTFTEQQTFVVEKLGIKARDVRGHFQPNEHELRVFLEGGQEVHVDTQTGRGTYKGFATRAVFFEVNSLHLNNLKGAWTYIADAFAVAMIVLALTGLFMNKGARGITGRGKWFVGAGLLVPVGAVIYMYS